MRAPGAGAARRPRTPVGDDRLGGRLSALDAGGPLVRGRHLPGGPDADTDVPGNRGRGSSPEHPPLGGVPAWWLLGRAPFSGLCHRPEGEKGPGSPRGPRTPHTSRWKPYPGPPGGFPTGGEPVCGRSSWPGSPLLRGNGRPRSLVDGEANLREDLFRGDGEARTTLSGGVSNPSGMTSVGNRLQRSCSWKAKERGGGPLPVIRSGGAKHLPEAWLERLPEGGVEVAGFS